MRTKNISKEFKIEVIASLLENRLLSTRENRVNEYDIYALCSFISGLDINKYNFYKLGNKIKNILIDFHPELNIRINRTNDLIYEIDIDAILYKYKELFGETYIIKSLNKYLVKTLEIQD